MSQNKPDSRRALEYQRHVKETAPKSDLLMDCLKAFLVGGLICTIGQGINMFAKNILQLDKDGVAAFTSIVLVFIGAFLTGIGVYDDIGKFAGAGSVVPITGFANSMVSPAIEFKQEGMIMGTGAKLFTIAGPVLVYGISASAAAALIKYLVGLFIAN